MSGNDSKLSALDNALIRYTNPYLAEEDLLSLPVDYARKMFLTDLDAPSLLDEAINSAISHTEETYPGSGANTYKGPWMTGIRALSSSQRFRTASKNLLSYSYNEPDVDAWSSGKSYDEITQGKVSWAVETIKEIGVRLVPLTLSLELSPDGGRIMKSSETAKVLLHPIILTLDTATNFTKGDS